MVKGSKKALQAFIYSERHQDKSQIVLTSEKY